MAMVKNKSSLFNYRNCLSYPSWGLYVLIIGASVRLSDSVPSCGGWPWLYFVVRSSDRVVVVDVDLLTAGCIEEIAGRRGKGQCTVSRGLEGRHIPSPASPSRTELNCQIKTFPSAHLFYTRTAIIKWWPGVWASAIAAIINQCWTTRYYMFPFVKAPDWRASVIIQSNMTAHFPSSYTGM